MARQKQVFPRDELAHLWAHRTQDSARDSGGSMYFTGPTLYSYGSHFVIGHWLDDGRLLWNDSGYSNTTATHKSIAYRAVPRFHWEKAVHVPRLDSNSLRDFAGLAAACVNSAMSALEAAQKARQRREGHIQQARVYLQSARELFMLAKCDKAAQAVPDVAADADKAAVAAVLMQAKRAEYLADADKRMSDATRAILIARRAASGEDTGQHMSVGEPWHGMLSPACGVMNAATACEHYLRLALEKFKAAGAKSTRAGNMLRECGKLKAQFHEQATDDTRAAALDQVRIMLPGLLAAVADFNRGLKPRATSFHHGRGNRNTLYWQTERVAEKLARLSVADKPADAVALLARAENMLSARRLDAALADTRDGLTQARADDTRATCDREVRDAAQRAQVPYWHDKAAALLAEVDAYNVEWDARAAVRNAEAIEAWRKGDNVRLPHDVPTMARIVGDEVQTSMGARVPLDHACRLARLARIAIRRGGQSWAPGDGPRVGHFQVQRIGADGSATIGCHEFSAAEGMRALAMLDACPTCAQVTESV